MLLEIMDTTEGGNLLAVKDAWLLTGEQLLGCESAVCQRAAYGFWIVKEE